MTTKVRQATNAAKAQAALTGKPWYIYAYRGEYEISNRPPQGEPDDAVTEVRPDGSTRRLTTAEANQ